MILIKFILRTCRRMMILTTITALISGACNAGLIALMNAALNRTNSRSELLIWGFVAMGLGKVISNFVSQVMLASFSRGRSENFGGISSAKFSPCRCVSWRRLAPPASSSR